MSCPTAREQGGVLGGVTMSGFNLMSVAPGCMSASWWQ